MRLQSCRKTENVERVGVCLDCFFIPAVWQVNATRANSKFHPVMGWLCIPNTIYIDLGLIDHWDMIPWTVLSIWRSQANRDKADWESKGFLVPMNEAAIDAEITSHLASPNTHGYVFIGHGADPGIINAYSHLGEDMSGTIPDRYTSHGIAFLTLKACYSAAKSPTPGKRYRYNAWESNVATRGWFVGYEGSVHTLNELFQWAAARGQNNKP
jgi:hypothetical protein